MARSSFSGHGPTKGNNIIGLTEVEDKERKRKIEEKAKAESNKANDDFTKEMKEGFDSFIKDESYFKDYDYVDIKKEGLVLIRFYKFLPKNKHISTLVMRNEITGAIEPVRQSIDGKVCNIAMIIRSTSDKHKKGDLIMVAPKKVFGETISPEYSLMMQMSKSNMEPILPDGFRKYVPNLEMFYAQYMIANPFGKFETEEDRLTYLLPEFEILSGYKI